MSAAMLIEAWGDTMLTTALLVLAVLLIRKPFARHFGARLTYSLWLIPALRLILPPLPFADPVTPQVAATSPETTVIHWTVGAQAVDAGRSEERRVGNACVSPCRSRWSPHYYKINRSF